MGYGVLFFEQRVRDVMAEEEEDGVDAEYENEADQNMHLHFEEEEGGAEYMEDDEVTFKRMKVIIPFVGLR